MARYYLPKALLYNLISPDYPAAALANLKATMLAAMANEPDWGVDPQTQEPIIAGPIIRWTEYSHGNVGGGKAWAIAQIQNLDPGRPSPFFEAMDNASQDGCELVRGSGDSTSLGYIDGDMDDEWKEVGRQFLVVIAGGDVHGVPVYFEFDNPDDVVPSPLGNGTETWAQWKQGAANSEPTQYGSKWYRSSCDYSSTTDSGQPLPASQWFAYYMGGGAVLSLSQYAAIQQANQPAP